MWIYVSVCNLFLKTTVYLMKLQAKSFFSITWKLLRWLMSCDHAHFHSWALVIMGSWCINNPGVALNAWIQEMFLKSLFVMQEQKVVCRSKLRRVWWLIEGCNSSTDRKIIHDEGRTRFPKFKVIQREFYIRYWKGIFYCNFHDFYDRCLKYIIKNSVYFNII